MNTHKHIKSHLCRRKDVLHDLHFRSLQAMPYLMKIFMYPTSSSANHWKDNAYSSINLCEHIRSRSRLPSSKAILNHTWRSISDLMEAFRRLIVVEESQYSNIGYDRMYSMLEEYFRWLSDKLSTKGSVNRDEVYGEINSIVSEHYIL